MTRIDVVTIFPEFFSGMLGASLLGKAIARGDLEVGLHQLRDWTTDKHRTVDDTPYGGGRGMVMKIEPLVAALDAVSRPGAIRILMSARGRRFTQARAWELANAGRPIVLVCGRYEGVDERIVDHVDEQLCIGDYVLSGGEAAAAVVIDAVARLVPGVVGNRESLVEESFADGLLEYPQYTRPEVFRGARVPDVLLSGNHGDVARWRHEQALAATRAVRPELLEGRAEDPAPSKGRTRRGGSGGPGGPGEAP
ncbi:MAG: tRNA (guanosine(37)-N1)-methyltransferase TrmD [Alphaproteobacteria bacterium]